MKIKKQTMIIFIIGVFLLGGLMGNLKFGFIKNPMENHDQNRGEVPQKSSIAPSFLGDFPNQNITSQFRAVEDVAVNNTGHVYVVDEEEKNVKVFDQNGNYMFQWGSNGSGDGEFDRPQHIAINSSGYVYVTERTGTRIQVFDPSGNYMFQFGEYGTGDGQFREISGITFNSTGHVFVVDYFSGSNLVLVFNPDGTFIRKWGTYGGGTTDIGAPVGIAINSTGHVHILVEWGTKVKIFDEFGTYIRSFGSDGSGDGQFDSMYSISINGTDQIYISDEQLDRIQIFDADGNYLKQWGSSGSGDNQFDHPHGITCDPNSNKIYVADQENGRISVFDENGIYLNQWGKIINSLDGQLACARGIAVNSTGHRYVLDSEKKCVQVFDENGDFMFKFGSFGVPTGISISSAGTVYIANSVSGYVGIYNADGSFVSSFEPTGNWEPMCGGLAINSSSGNVYVAEGGSSSQIIYTTSVGGSLGSWGSSGSGPSQFDDPEGIAINASGHVYVADTGNNRIQVFEDDGTFVNQWGSIGSSNGLFNEPTGITINETGHVFVVDKKNNRIQVFDENGNYIDQWGSFGPGKGQFNNPHGIVINNGRIYVSDENNYVIQIFKPNPNLPTVSDVLIEFNNTSGDLSLTYTYYDGDGDLEGDTQIRWYKNNVVQSIYNDLKLVPATAFTLGDIWNATVQPHDGLDSGSIYTSNSKTILPPPPVLLTITPNPSTTGNITLDWNDVIGASSYKVYRKNITFTTVGALTPIATPAMSTYNDTGLGNGTFYYAVVSTIASCDSVPSNILSINVGIPPAVTTTTTTTNTTGTSTATNSTTSTSSSSTATTSTSESTIAGYPTVWFGIIGLIGVMGTLLSKKKYH
jgi:DNA-binding beta-propeller fold protein YncE